MEDGFRQKLVLLYLCRADAQREVAQVIQNFTFPPGSWILLRSTLLHSSCFNRISLCLVPPEHTHKRNLRNTPTNAKRQLFTKATQQQQQQLQPRETRPGKTQKDTTLRDSRVHADQVPSSGCNSPPSPNSHPSVPCSMSTLTISRGYAVSR